VDGRSVGRQLIQAHLQKLPIGALLGQLQRPQIGITRRRYTAQAAIEIGASGMGEVIVGQFAAGQQHVDQLQPSLTATARLSSITGDGFRRSKAS
jgi:hypothetical protein